jgi:hypothetical protein
MKSLSFSDQDVAILKDIFIQTINLAYKIYGENLFKPFESQSETWKDKAYKAYYDAVMVGFSRHLEDAEILFSRQSRVIEKTKNLFRGEKSKLFTGGGKTKADILDRINLFDKMLSQVIAE